MTQNMLYLMYHYVVIQWYGCTAEITHTNPLNGPDQNISSAVFVHSINLQEQLPWHAIYINFSVDFLLPYRIHFDWRKRSLQ